MADEDPRAVLGRSTIYTGMGLTVCLNPNGDDAGSNPALSVDDGPELGSIRSV